MQSDPWRLPRQALQRKLRSWRLKAELQRLLAGLPVDLGDRLYHLLQTAKGLAPNPTRNLEFVDRVAQFTERVRPLRHATVVELGSGWFPTTPLTFVARGYASKVYTFDLNEHYSKRRIQSAAATLAELFPDVHVLRDIAASGILEPAIEYRPGCDIAEARVPDRSIDLAVSEFVLEHVTEADLERIHRASLAWMRDDGLWVHWISPGDHRAHSDRSLHPVDFLRFSADEWNRIAGNRFAYHNRLRRPHYRALFERAGWRVIAEDASVSATALDALAAVDVHPDFHGTSREDLVAGSLWFVLAKAS